MACLLLSGLTKNCTFILGGLQSPIYLGNFAYLSGVTDSNLDGKLDTIQSTAQVSGTTKALYSIDFEKNTGSFLNEMSLSNNQRSVKQSVSFSLAQKDLNVVAVAQELALGKVFAIGQDRNGNYFVFGRNNGLESTVVSLNSGAQEGDFSGLIVTMENNQIEYAPQWDNTIHPIATTYL